MCEFSEFTDVSDVSVDVADIDSGIDNYTEIDDIPEDIDYSEDISGDVLSDDVPMDVSVDFSEQESFEEFIIDEATENGMLDDIPEDVESLDSISEETEAINDNTISEDEFDWALENLNSNEMSQFRDAIESGSIKVEANDLSDDEDSGYVKVLRR